MGSVCHVHEDWLARARPVSKHAGIRGDNVPGVVCNHGDLLSLFRVGLLHPRSLHELFVCQARDSGLHHARVAQAVLACVQEHVLPVLQQCPGRLIKEMNLFVELCHLFVENFKVPSHGVNGHLGNKQILGLCWSLHADAARDELLNRELAAPVKVKEVEDLLRVVHGEVYHLQLVVDLCPVSGLENLFQCQSAACVHVCLFKNLA
mmetsp:Transcript_70869/g.163850  ORF Transcript_70869/g.163850 Transcript_70869/m.163850 type:complete len:206 (+) Transcript_70869:465-1082(+)